MKNVKKTLFLPIEIIARELDSKLLIAHKAIEKGFNVVIGPKGAVYKTAKSYGTGIYFYKDHVSNKLVKITNGSEKEISE